MNNLFSIKNKVFIITGTSSGIGKSLAENLTKLGAKVYGISRKKTTKVIFNNIVADIRNESKLKKIIKSIFQKEKEISVLINNAGVTYEGKNLDENIKNFNLIIDTNTRIPIMLAIECFKYMSKLKKGSIINICSLASKLGFSNNPSYVASKGGLSQASKALALDFGKKKIRVNNILPGYIKTNMTINSYKNKKKFEIRKSRTILSRWGLPNDLLGAVVFLSSDSSEYITGIDLPVDGGWLAKGL